MPAPVCSKTCELLSTSMPSDYYIQSLVCLKYGSICSCNFPNILEPRSPNTTLCMQTGNCKHMYVRIQHNYTHDVPSWGRCVGVFGLQTSLGSQDGMGRAIPRYKASPLDGTRCRSMRVTETVFPETRRQVPHKWTNETLNAHIPSDTSINYGMAEANTRARGVSLATSSINNAATQDGNFWTRVLPIRQFMQYCR